MEKNARRLHTHHHSGRCKGGRRSEGGSASFFMWEYFCGRFRSNQRPRARGDARPARPHTCKMRPETVPKHASNEHKTPSHHRL